MLRAGVEKIKNLLNSKTVYISSFCILITAGLTYYFINNNNRNTNQEFVHTSDTPLAATSTNVTDIVVDVSGAVNNPGLYSLKSGARVGEAVSLAGGISSDASVIYVSRNLNLAQKINDMDKIYIPFEIDTYSNPSTDVDQLALSFPVTSHQNVSLSTSPSISSSPSATQNVSGKTNINTSSLEDLDKLSGIGPAYAQRIIDNRTYKDFNELSTKSGIPKSTLDKIKDLLSY